VKRGVLVGTDAGVYLVDQGTMAVELLHEMTLGGTNPVASRVRALGTAANVYALSGAKITADKNGGAITYRVEDGLYRAFDYPLLSSPRCLAIDGLLEEVGGGEVG